ncbi:hypothetical protein [Roseibium aggregatum]|uniref:hypothetical protein n=1 Tax=Roseibium aggregatum TaxID=187304 RepID=UPI001E2D41D0|nr:hypothetical protein [Roseibium aggregatum]UES52179.1 hypothetical protein GFK88_22670 [Roseibium aggregatum]
MELDVLHWSLKAYWTLEEAAQICLGLEPLQAPEGEYAGNSVGLPPGVPMAVEELYDSICRAQVMGDLDCREVNSTFVVRPLALLDWCYLHGYVFGEDLAYEIEELARIKAGGSPAKAGDGPVTEPKGNDLNLKERESMVTIIIGMAVANYGHDPKLQRNGTAKKLSQI